MMVQNVFKSNINKLPKREKERKNERKKSQHCEDLKKKSNRIFCVS
jgi:hypothetical protein